MEAIKQTPAAVARYGREVKEELDKVEWPSRPEVIRYSAATIGISVVLAAAIAALDWGLNLGLEQLVAAAAR